MLSAIPSSLLQYVERTRRFMDEHYNQTVDIETIARQSGTSSNRFYKAFRGLTGLSPNQYMTKRRLSAAIQRLAADTSVSIMDVAYDVGYQDEYYFSRLFKKQMGISPSHYNVLATRRVASCSPVFRGDFKVLGMNPVLSLERGWSAQPDAHLDQIALCKPDFIVTSPVPEPVYEQLTKIAPVMLLFWKRLPWKERLQRIGDSLGLASVAERWLHMFEMKQETAQMHIRQNLGNHPFLVVSVRDDRIHVLSKQQHERIQDLFFSEQRVPTCASDRPFSILNIAEFRDLASQGCHCNHVIFLVHSSVTAARCAELEGEWKRTRTEEARCLFIRHGEPIIHNAAAHEVVLDQMMRQLSSVQ